MQLAARLSFGSAQARLLAPGVLACAVVGAASAFLAEHYGAPVMLFALLLGMAMNFLSTDGPCRPGIEFSARQLLRIGIALLGLRITIAQVAALALSAALPAHPLKDRATLFTVIGVSALSTVAMVLYPMLTQALGLPAHEAGMFLGATIHDVAQVVGAGYSLSTEAGDTATLVKLMRVAMLLPVIVFASLLTRRAGGASGGERPPLLPWFAVAFVLLVAVNSTGWVPRPLLAVGNDASRWFLIAAIAGIGMKTHLKDLATVGLKPVALMVGETVFLALLVLGLMRLLQTSS